MGTSKSYGGPGDASRLLPSWALPDTAPADGTDADGGSADDGAAGVDDAEPTNGPQEPDAPEGEGTAPSAPPAEAPSTGPALAGPVHHPWRVAKRSLSTALRGTGGHRDYRRAARDYVRARGGAQRATQAATSARGTTARFAGFLSSLSSDGVDGALRKLGLGSLAGRPAHDVLAAITNALAPQGATLADATSRQAIAETLAALWDARGVTEGGIERLQSMTADEVRAAIIESVSAHIFYQWALELGRAIERRAVSTNQAVTMEREMREYIRDTLKLDLVRTDVLLVDWRGEQGRQIVEKVFTEAYALIEST